jgi:hypothetical protein
VDVDLNEYAEVLGRLVEGPAMSSSSGSGAARFLPLMSRTGSRIVKGISEEVGLRRGLNIMLKTVRLETDTFGLCVPFATTWGVCWSFFRLPFPCA